MKNIFVGLLFIFLDFNLTIDHVIIGLMPDFLGYFILRNGLNELTVLGQSSRFEKSKPMVTFMIYFTTILYGFDLFGISPSLGMAQRFLGVINLCIYLWILYQIILGIIEMQDKYQTDMNGERLLNLWKIKTVLDVILIVLNFFPYLTILIAIFNVAVSIYFLVLINQTRHIYDSINQAP